MEEILHHSESHQSLDPRLRPSTVMAHRALVPRLCESPPQPLLQLLHAPRHLESAGHRPIGMVCRYQYHNSDDDDDDDDDDDYYYYYYY